MDIAGLQPEPVHRREAADGVAALAVPHQFWFCCRARGEIQQHWIVSIGRSVRRKRLRKIHGLFVRQPALLLRRRTHYNANKLIAAEA